MAEAAADAGRAHEAIGAFLRAAGLEHEAVGDRTWHTVLAGEHKRTVPVYLEVGDRHLAIQSFFMRAPDENEGELYGYLLGRHLRSYVFRFAVADTGDILIVGVVPVACVSGGELDRLLGQLLTLADDAFDGALRRGFTSYIEREQAWRANAGLGRNPIT